MTMIVQEAVATHECRDCPRPTPAHVRVTEADGSVEHLCIDCSAWRTKRRHAAEVIERVARSLGYTGRTAAQRWNGAGTQLPSRKVVA